MPWLALLALLLSSLFPAPRLAGTVAGGKGDPAAGEASLVFEEVEEE